MKKTWQRCMIKLPELYVIYDQLNNLVPNLHTFWLKLSRVHVFQLTAVQARMEWRWKEIFAGMREIE